jgi:hypothetical protein
MSTPKTTAKKKSSSSKKVATAKKTPTTAKKTPTTAKKAGPKTPPHIVAIPFQLSYLDGHHVEKMGDADVAYKQTTWFAVTITAPIGRRYLHVVQVEEGNAFVFYMIADRDAAAEGATLRLPLVGSFVRALVEGTVHVFGADKLLSRNDIERHIRGHEPPPQLAKPPYT